MGFGLGAVALDGQCLEMAMPPAQRCDRIYSTTPLGAGLLGSGAAVSLAGLLLLAVPGPHRDFVVTVAAPPSANRDGLLPSAATAGPAAPASPGGR
jgi:hypothetical protein